MKVNSDKFLDFISNKNGSFPYILFYGTNTGLVNLLYNTTLKSMSIDINDPFVVSKLNIQNLIDNPHSLIETLSTYSMISNKRTVLLDLCNFSINKNIINILISALKSEIDNCFLIIKADNLGSQNELVKFTSSSQLCLLVPCYEESVINIKTKLYNIFNENHLKFSNDFISLLSSKFSNDSSINQMEIDKLKTFLINNIAVDETALLNLINNNTDININKIAINCGSGDVRNALFFYEKAIQSSVSPIIIIKTLLKHFKIIENILYNVSNGNNIDYAMNSIRPPIFFKDKPLISLQAKIWTINKISLVKKRLTDAEIKCKFYSKIDKLLIGQLILSISVIAKNAIKP